MKRHSIRLLSFTLVALGMCLYSASSAQAQFGGLHSGQIFSQPQDARNSTSRVPAYKAGDTYDPRVWAAQRQAGRRRAGSPIRTVQAEMPAPSNAQPMEMPVESVPSVPGEVTYEVGPSIGGDSCGCGGGCGGACGNSCDLECGPGSCGSNCCMKMCCVPCPSFKHVQVFAGVQGFKGPVDNGSNGNFGFHEGINVTGRLPFTGCWPIGYQLGFRTTQSDLSGTSTQSDPRNQTFFTAGVFYHRPVGLQAGLAWDYLDDRFEDAEYELHQVRGEVSLLNCHGHEFGFTGIFRSRTDEIQFGTLPPWRVESTNQYRFFYRKHFECGPTARIWGGFSGDQGAVFGGDFNAPLNDRLAISGGFNYVTPQESDPPLGTINERWNVGISLVWHWHCAARSTQTSLWRPVFDVADNGSFAVQR